MVNIPGIEDLFRDYLDTPDWEKDLNNPAPALSHQMLIEIAAIIGLREVLTGRVDELLQRHDNLNDLVADMSFVQSEIADDLQRALQGTDLGKQCQAHELEWPVTLDVDDTRHPRKAKKEE
jgi:hypothetical protein